MKKKIFKILLVILITFFISDYTKAASACSWEKAVEKTIQTGTGSGGIPVYSTTESCPTGLSECSTCEGEKKSGDLCCSKAPVPNEIIEPKFNILKFQVKIPGLDELSEPRCTIIESQVTCGISWISEYTFAIYSYGLTIVGIIAVLILMAAGFLWIASGGDSGKITKAKEMIFGSIVGLLIMIAMSLLLSFINPDLTKQKTLMLSYVSDIEPASDEGNVEGSKECSGCSSIKPIPYDKREQGILNSVLAGKLLKVYAGNKNIYISESYPPTAVHQSKCHYNGMCADITITKANYTCKDVENLISSLESQGIKVLNEYVACNGTQTKYTTGGHLHIQ